MKTKYLLQLLFILCSCIMPKIIELTVELDIQKVSCPGVWLCQDGRVSLTVYALGTSYQTCMLPPIFPLTFRDVFYFRKRFQETCALNNMSCLLKDETIYCELVQWCQDCGTNECTILAQYLGSLNDVLFPPNLCTSDGVDLLMRRSKEFPGILSPKIEIATKVRIDEIWNERAGVPSRSSIKIRSCQCTNPDGLRQKPVCHSAQYHSSEEPRQKPVCHSARYHRTKCVSPSRLPSTTQTRRTRSRSRSEDTRSCCSLDPKAGRTQEDACRCANPFSKSVGRNYGQRRNDYCVFNVNLPKVDNAWRSATQCNSEEYDDFVRPNDEERDTMPGVEDLQHKVTLESRFIDEDRYDRHNETQYCKTIKQKRYDSIKPCICEICKRYHELFHTGSKS